MPHVSQRILAVAAFAVLSAGLSSAQVVLAPTTPQVGSSNPVSAEPLVSRPTTKPCTVQLFQNLAFADFNLKSFTYTPPAACPGPWAKVVFTADFTVSAGTQYDRTASFYLGHANIYYGTTSEPSSGYSPSWHVESDVTDLSPIFQSTQTGEANIGNYVGVYNGTDYNGIIYANAALEFYPANFANPAPLTPDVVVPVNGGGGDAGTLNTTSDRISQNLNLPENVESVYLDVIAQPQSDDEFYYFNVPDDEASNLYSDPGGPFRETEVYIDGKSAGVAPVYPFLNTGGIDPNLWIPIVGNQTHNFKPYRVNLTPFAGLLSDGNQHTVSVGVFGADSYFLATANLLVYEDHFSKKVIGGVEFNNLADPTPDTVENITQDPKTGFYTGSITVTSSREFAIKGYVNTSHGRVDTTVAQKVGFYNKQEFDVDSTNGTLDVQKAQQNATVDSVVTTKNGWASSTVTSHLAYPIDVNFAYGVNADGSLYENTSVDQKYETSTDNGFPFYPEKTFEETKSTDDQAVDASGNYSNKANSSQTYRSNGPNGRKYDETLTSAQGVLTAVSHGDGKK